MDSTSTTGVGRAARKNGRPTKLPSLTGLRFFAALLVFFFHTSLSNSPIPPNDPINPFGDEGIATAYEKALLNTGYIGVSFFFVLSGLDRVLHGSSLVLPAEGALFVGCDR
ncbi:acyltransferase family protein [Streptomyces cyaneofuscatus]|uniref:hypothetical protein n=1 Tax=Streptomyces cyaneofuscatus TaxID=66883 RepID=UPI00386D2FE2|nr:acyltransferase family protein [Streptomyces cyaneofuscatus]